MKLQNAATMSSITKTNIYTGIYLSYRELQAAHTTFIFICGKKNLFSASVDEEMAWHRVASTDAQKLVAR